MKKEWKMTKTVEDLKEAVDESPLVAEKYSRKNYLSSGSTLLNLGLSGHANGAFRKGCYYYIVGDSSSGKTFFSMTCFAEAVNHPAFSDHRLIFDDVENGALMDMEKFFGKRMAEKLEAPGTNPDGTPSCSSTIEDFYFNVDDALKDGRPFIYVLDSMDCLTSEKEVSEFDENKKLVRQGKEAGGSYGDGKAKKNSSGMRNLVNKLKKTDSILIVISQTRDDLGFGFNKKTRSGGRALKFYATVEIWTSVTGSIDKTVKGTKRKIGKEIEIKIEKNRQTGREWKLKTLIYPSYGIDDIESCINYLVEEKHWALSGQNLSAPEFDHKGKVKTLIDKIEEEGRVHELQQLVATVWAEIDEACCLKRKKRYE
jgi:RecA/RadA recombinase